VQDDAAARPFADGSNFGTKRTNGPEMSWATTGPYRLMGQKETGPVRKISKDKDLGPSRPFGPKGEKGEMG
jgi:hypothetical protein